MAGFLKAVIPKLHHGVFHCKFLGSPWVGVQMKENGVFAVCGHGACIYREE